LFGVANHATRHDDTPLGSLIWTKFGMCIHINLVHTAWTQQTNAKTEITMFGINTANKGLNVKTCHF